MSKFASYTPTSSGLASVSLAYVLVGHWRKCGLLNQIPFTRPYTTVNHANVFGVGRTGIPVAWAIVVVVANGNPIAVAVSHCPPRSGARENTHAYGAKVHVEHGPTSIRYRSSTCVGCQPLRGVAWGGRSSARGPPSGRESGTCQGTLPNA